MNKFGQSFKIEQCTLNPEHWYTDLRE